MNKNIYIILITLFSFYTNVNAQNSSENTLPNESVFLHFNSSFLVSGESIYYKLYCLNTKTQKLSTLSKIAYVELIDSDLNSIFKHKLRLIDGSGYGDFFIPSNITSGNYKLVAYTQWMLNWPNNYFANDITIINPFDKNKQDILVKEKDSTYTLNSTLINPLETISTDNSIGNGFTLSTNKKKYNQRQEVQLTILRDTLMNTLGKYSLSVTKIDSIIVPKMYSPINFKEQFSKKLENKGNLFLPELRGELISGKVLDKDRTPVFNSKVAISIPGKDFLFKISTTNNSGTFYTYLNESYGSDNAIFQILDDKRENYSIHIDSLMGLNSSNLKFQNFKITKAMQSLILNRSIQNQIDNSYSKIKLNVRDSIFPLIPFYESKISKTYILDDYNRFPTVKETVVEIIPEIFLRRRNKKNTFHFITSKDISNSDLAPMLIVDGILIQDHDDFLSYNSNNIEKIHISNSEYIFGTQVYEGIIAIETKNHNYETSVNGDFIKKVTLFKPLVDKTYYKQTYQNTLEFDRIPDYRNLLLWQPNLDLSREQNNITFYTSDVPGYYQIRIEGFTESGLPVSLHEVIEIE